MLEQELKQVEEGFAEIVKKIPPRNEPQPLTPYWLHLQIIERYYVLRTAHIKQGQSVIEIGCGPYAIATVPLAYMVGDGRVCAVDKGRWKGFDSTLQAASVSNVMPVECDATQLPFPSASFDTAVSIHAVRSFRNEDTIVSIFREMLRVSSRIFIAATVPIAKTKAQKAHIEMYNLREEIFEAVTGKKDDIHYFQLSKLVEFVKRANGSIIAAEILNVNLPHHLAFLPKEYVEKIKDDKKREDLLERREKAYQNILKYGEEHPPVGIIEAVDTKMIK